MRQPEALKKIHRSIFVKLLLVFLGTGLVISALVTGILSHFVHLHDHVWLSRNRNRIHYASLLADRIGFPPDIQRAKEIAGQVGMEIRIEKGNQVLFSTEHIPTYRELTQSGERCLWEGIGKVGVWHRKVYTAVSEHGLNYIFSYENQSFLDERPDLAPLLITLVLLALSVNYFLIRWLFKPIEWLSEGVRKVQKGQLDFQIKTRESDELGDLTKSFNQMTRQIAEQLKAKEQLLLDVSHELRSPITRIKVALELDDDSVKDQIKRNVRILEVMISELLESARLDTPQGGLKCVPTPVNQLVRKVAAQFREEKPGVLVRAIPENLIVNLDPVRVETVLKNLMENALKYSFHQSQSVEVDAEISGERLSLRVRDYGVGIPEEEQGLIFEPFYRIDKSRVRETGGYGLGLALCKKIMLAHAGNIKVSHSSESGTVFSLDFALA
jgi:signal transduction histidine kinase